LPIRDWKTDRNLERLGVLGMSARFAEAVGLTGLAQILDRGQTLSDARLLDGLVSIWQVDGAN
jgi:protease-4